MDRMGSLTARQIKAARALVDWSQDDLAAASGLSVATVRKLELGHISPRGKTTQMLRQAFENNGLEFIEPGGVRHKPEDITIYQGREGAKAFFDDVYQSSKKRRGEIVQVWPSTGQFSEVIGDYKTFHYERMKAITDVIAVKSIITEGDASQAAPYCECRWISKHYVDSVPFYVYDDKYAIILTKSDPSPKIVVFQSHVIAEAFRHQFYSMWEKATPLNRVEKMETPSKRKR